MSRTWTFKTALTVSTLILLSLSTLATAGDLFVTERARHHYTPERTFYVHHVKLELAFDPPSGEVSGRATTTLSPIANGLDEVVLDGVDLQVKGVELADGTVLSFENTGTQIVTTLDRVYDPADTITLAIEYSATPRMGLYFTGPDKAYPDRLSHIWSQGEMEENRHWFPCYDAPNGMSTSEIIATVPEDQTVISNGELVSVDHNVEARAKTYHWRESVPHVTYLNSIIVGEFVELKDEWDGIPIMYYVAPEDASMAERSFRKTPDMLEYYSTQIGVRYPYEKYAQTTVQDFRWGGMENASATTLTRRTLHDERYHLDGNSDGLVAHELAHQWFGDLVTTNNWNHIWLNEGFATYFDYLYMEHDLGDVEFMVRNHRARESYFKEDSTEYRRPIVTGYYENPEQMFDSHSYSKGSQVLHMIRYLLGDDLWWQSIEHYTSKHAAGNVITEDFRRAIEEVTGRPLEWFFEQWVYRGGHPEYEVEWSWSEDNSAVRLAVRQAQETDSVTPLFRMPVDVVLRADFGERTYQIEAAAVEQLFFLPAPSRPEYVEFDPEDWILKQLTFTKPRQEWLAQLAGSPSAASRKRAARALGDFAAIDDVVTGLRAALRDDDAWPVRGQAAKSLGKIKSDAARSALLSRLTEEPESQVRRQIVEALGEFKGDAKAAAGLKKQFQRDSSYYTQAEAIKSLVKIEAADAYDMCLRALKTDSHSEVIRSAALESLVEVKNPQGINQLMKWSAYGRPDPAREAAVGALGKLGEADWYDGDEALEYLIELLDDPYFRVERKAIEALGDYGDPAAIEPLRQVVSRSPDFRRQRLAREAIDKIEEKADTEGTMSALKSEVDELKTANEDLLRRLEQLEQRAPDSGGP